MRKEVILAIIIGLLLGSVLVYGLHRANQAMSPQNQTDQQTTAQPTAQPTPTSLLTIYSPQDGQIFGNQTATISGQTQPNNALIIITEQNELTPQVDDSGNFTQTIELIPGGNLIHISAITSTGQKQDQYINLVFTTQLE